MSSKARLPPRPNIRDGSNSSLPETDVSRSSLREILVKKKNSLTRGESMFLESLLTNGNEMEINTATERLQDPSIFGGLEEKENDDGEHPHNWTEEGVDEAKDRPNPKLLQRKISIKQQEHMESRKNSSSLQKLWRAHETGLSLTPSGSRMSVMKRSYSINSQSKQTLLMREASFLSNATQELLENGGPVTRPGEDRIFRRGNSSGNSFLTEGEDSIALNPFAMNIPEVSRTRALNRMFSDCSRKSVTFKSDVFIPNVNAESRPKLSRRQVSHDSFGAESNVTTESSYRWLRMGQPVRSESMSTFHSLNLHRAQPVRSDSMASMNTFNSKNLHRARPIRSESMSSLPSIHRSQPIRADSIMEMMTGEVSDPVWAPPLSKKNNNLRTSKPVEEIGEELNVSKPMLRKKDSWNSYQGEIEVSYCKVESKEEEYDINKRRLFSRALSNTSALSMQSWEERIDHDRIDRDKIFFDVPKSFTLEDAFNHMPSNKGKPMAIKREESQLSLPSIADAEVEDDDEDSWDMNSESDAGNNAWNVLKDPYAVGYGYGGGGHEGGGLPFRILGTSANDESTQPHVLSPPLMESLQQFLPFQVSENNFWLKYSLIRDGASIQTLLQNVRGARYTILAIETSDGDVFGSFTSEPWRKNWNYFGTGESFLWRMRQSRKKICHSIIDQAQMESELDVYPWTGENDFVQLCTDNKIAVGGGGESSAEEKKEGLFVTRSSGDSGFGLSIDEELLYGTSSSCDTFGNPPLCQSSHPDPFEIMNIELWTMTPCDTLDDAEKLELGKLFLSTQ
eukprot:CAMPEP_0194134576 /NCGR_PEP_ID=MMETSP0152-20130528/4645_1 /TAXON_ID=1049557 /ORGANISM="Thalassiothrix antarctica, Strain L6-D1" /LENGTH=792 /DNA_ID=CAMNT_0038830373 /DNA_START=154 /DNA_END=2532 /DNA_ORIENTATION=-